MHGNGSMKSNKSRMHSVVTNKAITGASPVESHCQRDPSPIASLLEQGVKVETAERSLKFDGSTLLKFDGSILDPDVQRVLEGQMCREVSTRGDGSCAVHAAFGSDVSDQKELSCTNPRALARTVLNMSWQEIKAKVRPHIRLLVCSVLL